ncbi:hypothetical protein FG05_35016 [Fusarium graminearum]|nr:hypothetical protein FG05_35016 [Fusarium graminearum]
MTLLPRHPVSARIKPPVTTAMDTRKKLQKPPVGAQPGTISHKATSQDAQSAPGQSYHKHALSYERFMQGTSLGSRLIPAIKWSSRSGNRH